MGRRPRELRGAGSDPARCVATIGPGICGKCYEVGEEVFSAVAPRAGSAAARRGRRLDLRAIHRAILEEAGLPAARIAVSEVCSLEDEERCFSHRREGGRTGRNGVLVGWRA